MSNVDRPAGCGENGPNGRVGVDANSRSCVRSAAGQPCRRSVRAMISRPDALERHQARPGVPRSNGRPRTSRLCGELHCVHVELDRLCVVDRCSQSKAIGKSRPSAPRLMARSWRFHAASKGPLVCGIDGFQCPATCVWPIVCGCRRVCPCGDGSAQACFQHTSPSSGPRCVACLLEARVHKMA